MSKGMTIEYRYSPENTHLSGKISDVFDSYVGTKLSGCSLPYKRPKKVL